MIQTPADPRAIASSGQAFLMRLSSLQSSVHASWHGAAGAALPQFLASSPEVQWHAFGLFCGKPPMLTDLQSTSARWCLLPPASLWMRLCALALARRPGVVRACLRRTQREMLESFLGPAAERLMRAALDGPATRAVPDGRPPIEWAWIGYGDLTRARLWPSRSLRRMVRLSIPREAILRAGDSADGRRLRNTAAHVDEVDDWFVSDGIG